MYIVVESAVFCLHLFHSSTCLSGRAHQSDYIRLQEALFFYNQHDYDSANDVLQVCQLLLNTAILSYH